MKEHWKYIPRDEQVFLIILKLTGELPDIMTYKDLILKDGSIYCKACGKALSFNMEVRGSLEFGLKLEGNEILMDEPNFQYSYAEATSDEFYCNNCGAHYQGAKKLFDGNTELNEEEMEALINSNKEEE